MNIDINDDKVIRKFAKRLYRYLEQDLEWTVGSTERDCDCCGAMIYNSEYEFCPRCGTELLDISDYDEDILLDLMDALRAALKGK